MRQIFTVVLFAFITMPGYGQEATHTKDPLKGIWLGKMQVSEEMSLQLAYQIELDEDGAYTAKMNVIEQKAFDIPMDRCEVSDDSIHILFDAAGIAYHGYYSHSEDKILGAYSQGGGVFTLDLLRVEQLPTEVERPQTPVRPFPYEEEDISFKNEEAGITLAATLTKPSEGKNLTAVVLIAGSGRNDRNETGMGHFLLLSDFLTRQGYAVLRYDKRGVGESEGDYGAATTFDFAKDARAAIDYLKSRPDIDKQSIGLIGHSEGALIAPIIAAEHKEDVAFIIMMGGIGIRGSELLLLQSGKMAAITGVPEEEISEMNRKNRVLYEIAASAENDSIVARKLKEADPEIDENLYNMLQWAWFRTFLSLEPDTYLSKVTCPVLAINGEKDVQCPPEENLAAIELSLQRAGNESYVVKSLPGLNHLFQTAESGSPYEYDQIAEIISPDALQLIVDWMDGTVK